MMKKRFRNRNRRKNKDILCSMQKNEITEYYIYRRLAKTVKKKKNADILKKIGEDEKKHYDVLKNITHKEYAPKKLKIWIFLFLRRILGLTFAIKLMESGEDSAQDTYAKVAQQYPELNKIEQDEHEHEKKLINLIDENMLKYVGSIVLGLNDALVELTGALAGLTFALQNSRLIALTGSITGVSAAFSMAASEYLSTKTEEKSKCPFKAAMYTGIAYMFTVIVLILPFLLLSSVYVSLGLALVSAILIIAGFNYYVSVAKDVDFKHRFLEMAGLSLGVAALSFGVGLILKMLIGVDI